MRKMILAAATAALLTVAGPAFAGPQGTADGETNNNVSCGTGTVAAVGPTQLQVNTAGGPEGGAVVICNDGAPLPIQGRIIAAGSTSGGGYVAIDGDRDNTQAEQAKGWARADFGSGGAQVRCGGPSDAGSGTNSESPSGGSQAYCG